MRYEFQVIKRLFKKHYYKFLLVLLFFFISMIVITYINPTEITKNVFNSLVGIPKMKEMSLLDYLWNLFQVFMIIYMSYNYFSYEEDNSIEFLSLRKHYFIFLFSKLIFASIITTMIRMIIYITSYFIFKEYVKFSLVNMIICVAIYLSIVLFTFIFYIIKRILK